MPAPKTKDVCKPCDCLKKGFKKCSCSNTCKPPTSK